MRHNVLLALACVALPAFAVGAALAEPVTLGGKVLDHQGKPLAKATLEVLPVRTFYEQHLARLQGKTKPEPVATAAAGPDGRFQIAVPEPGLWQVRVEAPGFAPREYQLAPFLEPAELPDARLGAASPLKVQVLDAEGHPVGGARVVAGLSGARETWTESGWLPMERTGTTGPDGTVTLVREAFEELKVQAVSPGLAEGEVTSGAGTAAASAVQVRLPAACATAVEVVDRERKPAAGALIAVSRWTGGLTDAAGRLTLALPCGKEVRIQAGLADGRKVDGILGAKRVAGEPLRLVLPPQPLRLAGRVLEEGTRQPVAGALVWTQDAGRAVWTDRNGAYTLTTPAAPKLLVQAASRRHFRGWAMHDLGAADSGTRDGPSFSLVAVAVASGTVVDEAGKPVSGAEVAGFPTSHSSTFEKLRTLSGDRGAFRLRVSPGTPHKVAVKHPDFAPAEISLPEITAHGSRTDLRIVLQKGQKAVGTVLDAREKPVAGARLVLLPLEQPEGEMMGFSRYFDGGEQGFEATSGADGRFSFDHLTLGRFNLRAQAKGFGPVVVPGLEIKASASPVPLGTVILHPGVELAGVVVDAKDQPVAGAQVTLGEDMMSFSSFSSFGSGPGDEGTNTDDAGRFVFSDLGTGDRFSVSVSREGYASRSVSGIELPLSRPLRIVLAAGSRLAGRVVDERGQPVDGAMVTLSQTGSGMFGGFGMPVGHAMADESGRFEIKNLEAGTLTLRAESEGLRPTEIANLELAAGKDLDNLEVVLRNGAVVTGQIVGPDGKPVSGAQVEVIEAGMGSSSLGISSDSDGKYRLEGVEPGPHVLAAVHSDYQPSTRDLDVRPGENRLDFRLGGGHTVSGRVVDAAGQPVEGAHLELFSSALLRSMPEARSGADGAFRFANVAAGSYELKAQRQGYSSGRLEDLRVAGPVDGVEVRLTRGGAIRGRILGAELPELGKVNVVAYQEPGGLGGAAQVDFRGEYRIEGLAPGEWKVMALLLEDGRRANGEVTVDLGGEAVLDLELSKGGLTLTGRVLRRGEPVDGMRVVAQSAAQDSGGFGMSNQDGAFRISGLEPGTYEVVAMDFRSGASRPYTLELTADQEIVIELPESRVSGQVVDAADSSPVEGAVVSLEAVAPAEEPDRSFGGRMATSDTSGAFSLSEVGEGSFRVVARKKGYAPGEATVQVGPGASVEGVRLSLSSTEGLILQVASARGLPQSVDLALLEGTGRVVVAGSYPVAEGGRVRLSDAPPGRWSLLVSSGGTATAAVEVSVPGPPTQVALPPAIPVNVSLPALVGSGVTANLTVQGADGRPFQAVTWNGTVLRQWPVHGGRAQLDALPPGNWKLTVTASDGRSWQGTAVLRPGVPGEITLR